MSLLVVGSMAFDTIITPFGKAERVIGGAATYIALSAAKFNVPIRLISVVGNDFPDEKIKYLESLGIDTKGLQRDPDRPSFFWAGKYNNDMNSRETLVTELNVLADFNPIVPEEYQDSEFLLLGNLSPVVQRQVIERLRNRPKLIAMDTMNFWMDTQMDELLNTLKLVDILSINDEEARQLSGEYSIVKAAKKILSFGPKYLVVKKGEHGALLFNNEEVFYAPALPLDEVFDPTGAGDTFAGGFMGYLASHGANSFNQLKRGIIYGSALASFCVEKFSTERLENLTKQELDARIQNFVNLVQFEIDLK